MQVGYVKITISCQYLAYWWSVAWWSVALQQWQRSGASPRK